VYETARLRFRRLDPVLDLEDRLRWANDPAVYGTLAPWPQRFTREELRPYLEASAAGTDEAVNFTVETRVGRPIGGVSLYDFSHVARSAEFSIVIGEAEYRGKGYGTEAARLMLDVAFRYFNLNRVSLRVFAHNEGGIRAYEKAGFVKEALLRQATYLEGEYHDAWIMAALRPV
jgi:RimJ/RimL family protein N-acetyltransferase